MKLKIKKQRSISDDSPTAYAVKDARGEEIKAARIKYLWGRLRDTILDTVNASLENDAKERTITHGVHHLRQIMHRTTIQQGIFIPTTEEFITVDEETIRVFASSGIKKNIIVPEEKIDHVCYIKHIDSYVGWYANTPLLCLFSKEFDKFSLTEAASDVYNVTYNEPKEELLVCGNGIMQSYVFRFGNRHMIARHQHMEHELLDGRKITMVTLEGTASKSQRCFTAFDNCVAVFTVSDCSFVTWRKNMHAREITAILFFNPLKYLITGSRDGSIKVWDIASWRLQFVFVGHTSGVTSLALYPRGPHFISTSSDSTLRVWNLEMFDQVDKQELEEPAKGICTDLDSRNFCTYCDNVLHLWSVDDLHSVHTLVGYQVHEIKSTVHPNYPLRAVAKCKDSSVRIITPESGEVMTTLLLDSEEKLVDAAYAIADELMFCVLEGGDILKCSTTTNPVTVLARWKYDDPKKHCNYLLIYEYVIGNQNTNPWKSIARAFATKHLEVAVDDEDEERTAPVNKNQDRTLLLGGRKDGYLCVFNWDTGQIEFEIEGHGSKGVLSMVANSPDDQVVSSGLVDISNIVVSAGHDNVIKVWRLFPYAQESLSPMMSFYCSQTPLHMCVMTGKLGVAFHEHASATYAVVVYNIGSRARKDHSPEDDHTDTITALAACNKMKLFASASLDGSIKVWSDTNKLIRYVKLNAIPHSLDFVDQRGTLLVGIGKNIHRIDAADMLPKVYRFKQVTMKFNLGKSEARIPFTQDVVEKLSKDEKKRLQASRPAYKFSRYSDELSDHELADITEEERKKQESYQKILDRQQDVINIRDGLIKADIKRPSNKMTKHEAFIRYLSIFYDRPKVKLGNDDLHSEIELSRHLLEEKKLVPSSSMHLHLIRHYPVLRKLLGTPNVSILSMMSSADHSLSAFLGGSSVLKSNLSTIQRTSNAYSGGLSAHKHGSLYSGCYSPSSGSHSPSTGHRLSSFGYQSPSGMFRQHLPGKTDRSSIEIKSSQMSSTSSGIITHPRFTVHELHEAANIYDDEFMPDNCFTDTLKREIGRMKELAKFEHSIKIGHEVFTEDPFAHDSVMNKLFPPDREEDSEHQYKDAGFFPDNERATPLPIPELLKQTGYNIEEDKPLLEPPAPERVVYPSDPRGYIPNSVLVRLLFPEPALSEEATKDNWRPPILTDSQLAEIGQTRRRTPMEAAKYCFYLWKDKVLLGPKSIAELAEERALQALQVQSLSSSSDISRSSSVECKSELQFGRISNVNDFLHHHQSQRSIRSSELDSKQSNVDNMPGLIEPSFKQANSRSVAKMTFSLNLKPISPYQTLVADYLNDARRIISRAKLKSAASQKSKQIFSQHGMIGRRLACTSLVNTEPEDYDEVAELSLGEMEELISVQFDKIWDPRENTTADRVFMMSDDDEPVSNDALLKKSAIKPKKKKTKKKGKVSFGVEPAVEESAKNIYDEPEKPKDTQPPTTNSFLSKMTTLINKSPSPPVKVAAPVIPDDIIVTDDVSVSIEIGRRVFNVYPGRISRTCRSVSQSTGLDLYKLSDALPERKQHTLFRSYSVVGSVHRKQAPTFSGSSHELTKQNISRHESAAKEYQADRLSHDLTYHSSVMTQHTVLSESSLLPPVADVKTGSLAYTSRNQASVLNRIQYVDALFDNDLNIITPFNRMSGVVADGTFAAYLHDSIFGVVHHPPKTPSPEPPPKPVLKQQTAPRKPIQKLVSRPPPPKPAPVVKIPATPPPPKEPTPTPTPPPPTPLPEYITQFFGEEWFDQYFPNCSSHTFPKPWTVDHFVTMLLRILKLSAFKLKHQVVKVLSLLYSNEGYRNIKETAEACLEVLNPALNTPTSLDKDQKMTIMAILTLLKELQVVTKSYYAELMCQFIDGDQDLRKHILDLFLECGLSDPHHYFGKELDNWDTWALEGGNRKSQILEMCIAWLDKWMSKFKTHLRQGIEMLKQGQSVHTRVGRGNQAGRGAKAGKKAYTVTFTEPPSAAVIDNATYIESINYFCEMAVEVEIEKMRNAQKAEEKLVETKNTVLVLPKLQTRPALVRLGELHTGATTCKPSRETVLQTDHRKFRRNANGEWALPPGTITGFVPFIKQPMKNVYMNPFPSAIDKYDRYQQEPILITLKTSPKYFIHDESYVPWELVN